MELGSRLKEIRNEKGLSLDDVQEITKIQKRYLLAIEEGNYSILPGSFYAKAFIKEYALAVGLDASELLEEYKDEIPHTANEDSVQYTRIQRSRKENNSNKDSGIFSVIPTVIVGLLIVGIFFAAWFFYQKTLSNDSTKPIENSDDNVILNEPADDGETNGAESDNKGNDESADKNDESADNPDEKPEKQQDEQEIKLTVKDKGTGASPESTLDLENAGDTVKITFKSKGKSYLQMKNASGKSYFEGTMDADNSPKEIEVTGDKRLYLNIGYAPALDIAINGVEMDYPIDANDKVHQKLWINLVSAEDQ